MYACYQTGLWTDCPANIVGIEGEQVGILGFGLAGLFWLLVPFLDRSVSRKGGSPLFTWIGGIAIFFILLMTFVAYWHAWSH